MSPWIRTSGASCTSCSSFSPRNGSGTTADARSLKPWGRLRVLSGSYACHPNGSKGPTRNGGSDSPTAWVRDSRCSCPAHCTSLRHSNESGRRRNPSSLGSRSAGPAVSDRCTATVWIRREFRAQWPQMIAEATDLAKVRRMIESGLAREVRVRARLNESEAARAVGVHPSTLHRWERGQQVPRGRPALRYAELLQELLG